MTVSKLDNNRLLIILGAGDIEELSLRFGEDSDGQEQQTLLRLTRRACRSTGIDPGGCRIHIEALPLEQSCYLLVTVGSLRRRYRRRTHAQGVCYCLGGSGNFLDAMALLYQQNVCCTYNAAYEWSGAYYLLFDYPVIPERLRVLLSEFGTPQRGRLERARLRENGTLICPRNAISVIGSKLVP